MEILNEINELPLIPLVTALIGLCIFLLPFFPSPESKKLSEAGIRAEGVIFRIENRMDISFNSTPTSDKIITIRFVTKKKEWITEELKNEVVISYTGQYKEGEKVIVIYDPDNPSNFLVETKQFLRHSKFLFSLAGVAIILISIYFIVTPD